MGYDEGNKNNKIVMMKPNKKTMLTTHMKTLRETTQVTDVGDEQTDTKGKCGHTCNDETATTNMETMMEETWTKRYKTGRGHVHGRDDTGRLGTDRDLLASSATTSHGYSYRHSNNDRHR